MPNEVSTWTPVLDHAERLYRELASQRAALEGQRERFDLEPQGAPPGGMWLLDLDEAAMRSAGLGAAIALHLSGPKS